MDVCDADCVPGGWGAWGDCSAECGGGTQTRNLASFTPLVGSGNDCVHSETRDCNMDACVSSWSITATLPDGVTPDVGYGSLTYDGLVAQWEKSPGSMFTQDTSFFIPIPGNIEDNGYDCCFGRYCNHRDGKKPRFQYTSDWLEQDGANNVFDWYRGYCGKAIPKQSTLNLQFPTPGVVVIFQWGYWNGAPGADWVRYGGLNNSHDLNGYMTKYCGGVLQTDAINSSLNDYYPHSMTIMFYPEDKLDQSSCGSNANCPRQLFDSMTDCPVDVNCASSYSAWSDCSANCRGGTQSRTLSVTTPASGAGTACPPATETQDCNTGNCPVMDSRAAFIAHCQLPDNCFNCAGKMKGGRCKVKGKKVKKCKTLQTAELCDRAGCKRWNPDSPNRNKRCKGKSSLWN